MKKNVTLNREDQNFLALLKEPPPAPNDHITRLLIEILEEGGSLANFHQGNSFAGLLTTSYFILNNVKYSASIKDTSIASNIPRIESIPNFRVPKIVLTHLKRYLQTLGNRRDEYNNQLRPRDILEMLPYWP